MDTANLSKLIDRRLSLTQTVLILMIRLLITSFKSVWIKCHSIALQLSALTQKVVSIVLLFYKYTPKTCNAKIWSTTYNFDIWTHIMVSYGYRHVPYQIVRGRLSAEKNYNFSFFSFFPEKTHVLLQKTVRGRFKFENCPRPL